MSKREEGREERKSEADERKPREQQEEKGARVHDVEGAHDRDGPFGRQKWSECNTRTVSGRCSSGEGKRWRCDVEIDRKSEYSGRIDRIDQGRERRYQDQGRRGEREGDEEKGIPRERGRMVGEVVNGRVVLVVW